MTAAPPQRPVSAKYEGGCESLQGLLRQATRMRLLDLLQLSEFAMFARYACCGDRLPLTDLLLRQMETLHVTRQQVESHFATFTSDESLTMLRWEKEMYAFPALSIRDGTSARWKELTASGTNNLNGSSSSPLDSDDTKALERKKIIIARLEAHEAIYPHLRLDILEAGELVDMHASEFFWCAPPLEYREKVSQILSTALRDVDEKELHARLNHFLLGPQSRSELSNTIARSAAVLRLETQLTRRKELMRCSTIGGTPLTSIVGKFALAEEFVALKRPPTLDQEREDRKKLIISRLAPLSLSETRDYARNLRLNVRLETGGHSGRALKDIHNDIAEAIIGPQRRLQSNHRDLY